MFRSPVTNSHISRGRLLGRRGSVACYQVTDLLRIHIEEVPVETFRQNPRGRPGPNTYYIKRIKASHNSQCHQASEGGDHVPRFPRIASADWHAASWSQNLDLAREEPRG